MLAENAAEEAAAAAAMGVRRVGAIEDLQCLDEDLDASGERLSRCCWGLGFRCQGLGFRVYAQCTQMIQSPDPPLCM